MISPADQEYHLEVFDLMGRVIHSDSFNSRQQLNVEGWQSGLYIFSIRNAKGERVQATKVSIY